MKKVIRTILFVLLSIPGILAAQDSLSVLEKVYLHTDQETYVTGEYLWFSAYVMEDGQGTFSQLSKVLYVEILDRESKPVLRTKITLENGSGNGSLFLPASMGTDVYQIRAYTRWMRNSGPAAFFRKWLRVFNPFIPVSPEPVSEQNIKTEVFAEAGSVISGEETRFVVSVKDENGRGIPYRAMVIGSNLDTIRRFTPVRHGIGSFEIIPVDSIDYRIEVRNIYDSLLAAVPVPSAKGSAMSMRVSPEQYYFDVKVICKDCRNDDEIRLLVKQSGRTYKQENINISDGQATLRIPRSEVPSGVSKIVVSAAGRDMQITRNIFNEPEISGVRISMETEETGTREQVSFKVRADSASRLSVSVYREDALNRHDHSAMLPSLFLDPEGGMAVEDPAYYFNGEPEATELMDNLMVLSGADKLTPSEEIHLPEIRGQLIEARVTDPSTGDGMNNVAVYASLAGQPFAFRVGLSDSTGTVRFQAGQLHGERSLILQPADAQDSTSEFTIFPSYSTRSTPVVVPDLSADESIKTALEERSMGMQMENIYHGEEKGRMAPVRSDSLPFYGTPDRTYYLDDYTRFPSMLDVLKEYVYTVAARRRNDTYILRVFDEKSNSHFNSPPLVLLDGVPISDHNKMVLYDPLLVEKIDVVTSTYIYGPISFSGIVSFSTYKGNMQGFNLPASVVAEEFDGVQYERRFFIPDYDQPDEDTQRKPDMRSLLYWNPLLETGPDGTASASFYTSDRTGTFIIRIEGFTPDGRPLQGSARLVVRPGLYSEK